MSKGSEFQELVENLYKQEEEDEDEEEQED